MKVSQEFNKYFRAEDITAPVTLTIQSAEIDFLGEAQEKNLVISFTEDSRRLVAKPMRRNQLVALFGDDTSDWADQQVELYTTKVWFGQKQVPSIQIRMPGQAGGRARRADTPLDDLNDELPF
jgi:hypothetical protein